MYHEIYVPLKDSRKAEHRHHDAYSLNQPQAHQSPLTYRELQVLLALSQGHRDKAIATQLSLSHKTVQHHIRSLFRKRGT